MKLIPSTTLVSNAASTMRPHSLAWQNARGSLFLFVLLFSASTIAEEKKKKTLDFEHYAYCLEDNWLDDAYCYLNFGIDSTANGLNNLFKTESMAADAATTKGRLRFGWEPRTRDLAESDFRFRIRAKFPAFEDRVELLFSDEEDDIGGQNVKAARNRELGANDQAVVALQFQKDKSDKMRYRVGFGRGSQLYTRARYSDIYNINDGVNFYYFAETNYYARDKLGFELNGELGVELTKNTAFEINNSFQFRDKTDDWFWRHEFQYIYLAKNQSSYLLTAMIDGLSKPSYQTEQILLSVRYKRKVLRDWLFVEVEPFLLWLREEDFKPSLGAAIRAEIHFSTK
ncbi:hypothetical protein [Agaribacter flavus]|uniref:Uncharacterized protein n=1 Tax=Agaribacter flavus TaxID=1902781 RepID=A0ABV7FPV0_9ALTE